MYSKRVGKEIEDLREAILYHDYLYYILQKPLLPDRDFDVYKKKLLELENLHPEFYSPVSPTQRYANLTEPTFLETTHVSPFSRFRQDSDPKLLSDFMREIRASTRSNRVHFSVEPKIRGVDVELVYERGEFVRAVLSRDAYRGVDVTQNVRALKYTPLKLREREIPAPPILAVHGVLYMTEKDFYEYNFQQADNGDRPFFSHKSLIEYLLLQSDTWITTSAPLRLMCLDISQGDRTLDMVTYFEIRDSLKRWGFQINETITEPRTSVYQARNFRDNLLRLDYPLPYEVDGAVVKVVETSVRDEIGSGLNASLWGVELLFPPVERAARVREISYAVDQRGVIVATADFDEVYFKGVEVEQAPFKRVDDVTEWDVRPGDFIRLERDKHSRTFVTSRRVRRRDLSHELGRRPKRPTLCPSCGQQLEYVRDVLRCVNRFHCKAQLTMRILHFVSEDAMNIKYLGPGRIQEMLERELIHDIGDLFTLKWQDLIGLPMVKEQAARNIIREIKKSKKVQLRNFLFALQIKEVGHVVSAELERVFYTLHAVQSAPIQALLRLRAVGPMAAQSIYLYFKDPEKLALIDKLYKNGVRPYNPNVTGSRKLLFKGQQILLVGSLRKYRRRDVRNLIEAEGGTVVTNHRVRSDIVIFGKGTEEKVRRHYATGALVWGEAQFLRYLQENGVG